MVALRKESVDRNFACVGVGDTDFGSLSARRAWIEIAGAGIVGNTDVVALRKESVDRNAMKSINRSILLESLSARRAWIEMRQWQSIQVVPVGRSPQGERG